MNASVPVFAPYETWEMVNSEIQKVFMCARLECHKDCLLADL